MKPLTTDQKIKLLYVAADIGTEKNYMEHYQKMLKLIAESDDESLHGETELINEYLKPVKAWINAIKY